MFDFVSLMFLTFLCDLFLVSKCNTRKNMSGQNQPPSREVKDLASKKLLDFRTFEFSGRYIPPIPSQSTPKPTYTSSPETPNPH